MASDPGVLELRGGAVIVGADERVTLRGTTGAARRLRARLERLLEGEELVIEPDEGPDLVLQPTDAGAASVRVAGDDLVHLALPVSDVHGWRAALGARGDKRIELPCSGGVVAGMRIQKTRAGGGHRRRKGEDHRIVYAANDPAPTGVVFYRVYCGLMATMYLLLAIAGVLGAIFREELAGEYDDPNEFLMMGVIYGGCGLAIGIPFVASFFLPRQQWAWIVGIILIGLSLTSVCCLPISIPLLFFWLKPETKGWFHPPEDGGGGGGGEDLDGVFE